MFKHKDNEKKMIDEFNKKKCIELENLENLKKNLENLRKITDNPLFNEEELQKEITEIDSKIKLKEDESYEIKKFIKKYVKNQENKIDGIISLIDEYKPKLIKNLNLNLEEFNQLSKKLEQDFLKVLYLIHDEKEKTKEIYMCDFNYELINICVSELSKDEQQFYINYFSKHINTIFEDFNDLEKYEDFNINYVNDTILNIIYINVVNTVSWEIYNNIIKYFLEKFDIEPDNFLKEVEMRNIIIKNIKLLLKNIIYDKLAIKNPDKSYELDDFYRELIITNSSTLSKDKFEEIDRKKIEFIIIFYSKITEIISNNFYEEIKNYLINQRKIILLLKIYKILIKSNL
jgi:hypothetical protein